MHAYISEMGLEYANGVSQITAHRLAALTGSGRVVYGNLGMGSPVNGRLSADHYNEICGSMGNKEKMHAALERSPLTEDDKLRIRYLSAKWRLAHEDDDKTNEEWADELLEINVQLWEILGQYYNLEPAKKQQTAGETSVEPGKPGEQKTVKTPDEANTLRVVNPTATNPKAVIVDLSGKADTQQTAGETSVEPGKPGGQKTVKTPDDANTLRVVNPTATNPKTVIVDLSGKANTQQTLAKTPARHAGSLQRRTTEIHDQEFERFHELYGKTVLELFPPQGSGLSTQTAPGQVSVLSDLPKTTDELAESNKKMDWEDFVTSSYSNSKPKQVAKAAGEATTSTIEQPLGQSCFTGDTLVLGPDGGRIRIDQLKAGARVATWDQLSGRPAEAVVAEFLQADSDHYFLINDVIKVTQHHRVLTARGEWVRVKDLKTGMILQGENGPLPVQSIILKRGHFPVYNFDVAQGDSFLVAAGPGNWLVVHNGCGGGK
jgi:hypothetical protein